MSRIKSFYAKFGLTLDVENLDLGQVGQQEEEEEDEVVVPAAPDPDDENAPKVQVDDV